MTEWKESLKVARVMMVLSSLSPLFILWAVRGNPLIPDYYLVCGCLLMMIVPNAFLYERILAARRNNDKRMLKIVIADDHRDHLLVYLFAILLPLYDANLSQHRDFAATLVAFSFIVFLFWHLNLHYMNLIFAFFGYRVYTIRPSFDEGSISTSPQSFVLLTKRTFIPPEESLYAYRISNTVYLEIGEEE